MDLCESIITFWSLLSKTLEHCLLIQRVHNESKRLYRWMSTSIHIMYRDISMENYKWTWTVPSEDRISTYQADKAAWLPPSTNACAILLKTITGRIIFLDGNIERAQDMILNIHVTVWEMEILRNCCFRPRHRALKRFFSISLFATYFVQLGIQERIHSMDRWWKKQVLTYCK